MEDARIGIAALVIGVVFLTALTMMVDHADRMGRKFGVAAYRCTQGQVEGCMDCLKSEAKSDQETCGKKLAEIAAEKDQATK